MPGNGFVGSVCCGEGRRGRESGENVGSEDDEVIEE